MTAFERKVLRRMFGGIKVDGNWRQWYDKELMQKFGDLDIVSVVRISLLNWIDHVYRIDSIRKVSQVLNNNLQGDY